MQEYEVTGPSGETYTVQLEDDDAKARGLTPKKAASAPNKSKTAKNKSA